MRESRQNDEQIYRRKPLESQQSSAMLEIWQNSALRAQTRIVCAEGWGLLIFDWFILSMRMQAILDARVQPLCGAGRKESSGTGLRLSLPEDQAGVIHAISPFWKKLCQIEGTTQQP